MADTTPRTETAYGADIELGASIPIPHHPIFARVSARFERRVVKGVEDIAQAAGVTAESVLARLESEAEPYADLLEQTLRGIERKASAEHRRAMARVAAQAWSGDDAEVDRAVLVNDTLADLQPVHVRVLVVASRLNDQAGRWSAALEGPPVRPSPVTVDRIAEQVAINTDTVRGIIGQLVAEGLLWVDSVTPFYNSGVVPDHVLSELGADVLNALE